MNSIKKDLPPKLKNIFVAITAAVIFFTTSDLLANGFHDLTMASICSIASGFFVFLGSAIKKQQKIEKEIYNKVDYICSNFNRANRILSVLDIVCSIIALLTAVVFIGAIFRSIFALRLLLTINKVKTVCQTVLIAVSSYMLVRIDKLKENNMWSKIFTSIKSAIKYIFVSNPKASIATLVSGVVSAFTGIAISEDAVMQFLPDVAIGGYDIMPYIAGILVFIVLTLCGVKYAFETNEEASARRANEKALKEEKNAKKQEAKVEARALALYEKKKAEQESIEKQKEEETRLLKLADDLIAKKNAEETAQVANQEQQVNENKKNENVSQ